jgi:hypothetical protein
MATSTWKTHRCLHQQRVSAKVCLDEADLTLMHMVQSQRLHNLLDSVIVKIGPNPQSVQTERLQRQAVVLPFLVDASQCDIHLQIQQPQVILRLPI